MYHINKESIGNGENITLQNTAKHYFKKFNILGNSVQEATPSIDSEAPIESVGDNINLYDAGTMRLKNGLWSNGNGAFASNASGWYVVIPIIGGESYAISKKHTRILVCTTSEVPATGVSFVDAWQGSSSISEYVISTSLSAKYLFIGVGAGLITDEEKLQAIEELKVSKGTSTGAYSPYGQGSIEIYNCNENFLQNEGVSKTINGVAFTVNKDGTVIANGTATDNVSLYVFAEGSPVSRKPLNIKNGDYILSGCPAGGGSSTYRLGMIYSEGSNNYVYIVDNGSGISFNYDGKNVGVYCEVRKGYTANNLIFKPMIRLATDTDDTFGAHQSQTKALYTQQPLRAIGDVKDRFVKVDGVWHEEHSIARLILNGTEEWTQNSGKTCFYYTNNMFPLYDNPSKVHSNYFEGAYFNDLYNAQVDYGIGLNSVNHRLAIRNKDITTIEIFKAKLVELYNAGTPLYVDYVLATPTLIECTPEQVEQLEEIEKEMYSYDEVTNIYSTDTISPYFEVTAYQRISEEFKTRLKEGKITRGYLKVLATDTLPELIIDENNYLKDLKIEELRYVPEEGFIGGAVAKRVTGNFNNVDNSFDIQDREVEVYLGVELEDETTEYIKYGTYIVQRPEDDQVNDNTSFEALDYMVKFNQEYKDRITYPCTLKQLLDDIVDQAGVNSKIATFANSEFVVENNQFEQGTTLRDVLKAITQMAFNWSRIDADDNLVMDFDIKEDIDEELGTDDYFGFKKTDDYGPVNVIVLRNSQVEGENVTIKDEELINTPKGYNLINARYNVDIKGNDAYKIKVEPNTYYLLTLEQICIALGENTRSQHWYKIFDKEDNKLKEGTIIPFDFTEANEIKSGKKSLLMPETADYISIDLGSYNATPNTLRNLEVQFVKGKEEKPYQPFVPTGEIELVIADNPFAYTELKRKQLIEAGRRLFGLRYTPMAVDMLGLMYLNAKDRISVENLNGEKFNTYLLDHTIDYTGIVLDSMQSQAKTKTETKYQYLSPLAQGLSHVEIKVDKANKRIESIVKTQEDVSEKVANTISRVEVVYALSDSATVAPTSGWSTTAPEWVAGKYMWQKTITTYANGTTAETATTNITGAKGEAGQNGIGITQTNITYQKSTSGTTTPTGTWQPTIPEVDENSYLWTRTEFIYSDGSKKYAYSVGKKGATGIGVKSLVDQYYLSTSNTTQTGGSWKETQDAWEEGKYIWTRTKIIWTNDSVTYTTPILANTLNDINSNIIVLKEFNSQQSITNSEIKSSVEETTKRLTNDYLTAEQVNSKIDGLDEEYEILEKRVASTELTAGQFQVQIDKINNQGVDKITTSVGYTFDDTGLNIDRTGADTATTVNEKGIEVSDKTGSSSTPLLYAGYVEEGNTDFPDYEGQTIVAASNLIVKNYLVIGLNSRFQDYINPALGGQGTGAFDI